MKHSNPRGSIFLLLGINLIALALAFFAGFLFREKYNTAIQVENDFPVLTQAIALLRKTYLFDLPANSIMEHNLIRGLLLSVQDPYTTFVEPAQHEIQTNNLEGKYGGIGARIESDSEGNIRIYPYPDSPAAIAGVLDGDILLRINQLEILSDTTNDNILAELRGPIDEPVEIRIIREKDNETIDFLINRTQQSIPSTVWNVLPENNLLGIIKINRVAATTAEEVDLAVYELMKSGVSYFILDLRDNSGGLVDAGINTAKLFLNSGAIMQQQYKGKPVETFSSDTPGKFLNIPLVIFVNKDTASASEIIAGAIQAQKRAQIIGTNTYGKDTIQLVFNLTDNSSIHITAARWWIPGLEFPINGKGLQPDIGLSGEPKPPESDYIRAALQVFRLIPPE